MSTLNANIITHLEGDKVGTIIHYHSGKTEHVSYKMNALLPRLPTFVRIHKGFAVNPYYARYSKTRRCIQVHSKEWLPISKTYKTNVELTLGPQTSPSVLTYRLVEPPKPRIKTSAVVNPRTGRIDAL